MNTIGRIFLVTCVVAVFLGPRLSSANPNSVAKEFFNQLQTENYTVAAQLFDPKEAAEFRELLSFIYENVENDNDELIEALFGVGATGETVSQLSDAEFLGSFLALTMGEMKKSMPVDFSGIETLGYVTEAPNLAHVVTRFSMDMSEGAVSMVDVVSVRQINGDWRIMMQADMKALANQLKASYGHAQ